MKQNKETKSTDTFTVNLKNDALWLIYFLQKSGLSNSNWPWISFQVHSSWSELV